MSKEIRVVAVLQGRPGTGPAVEAAIQRCVTPSRQEAGCHFYTAHRDIAYPYRIVVIERWDSVEALEQHKSTPHYLALGKDLTDLLSEAPQVSVLESLGEA